MYNNEYFVKLYFEEIRNNLPTGSYIDYFHDYNNRIIIYYNWGSDLRGRRNYFKKKIQKSKIFSFSR
jgi:hypothetical protein